VGVGVVEQDAEAQEEGMDVEAEAAGEKEDDKVEAEVALVVPAVVKVVEEKADDEVEVEVADLRIDPVLFRLPYGAQRKPV